MLTERIITLASQYGRWLSSHFSHAADGRLAGQPHASGMYLVPGRAESAQETTETSQIVAE